MSVGPRPRRPLKVVVLVLAYWIGGSILQSALSWLLVSGGLLDVDNAYRAGLFVGWGLLVVVSFVYRERLDHWLRT